MRKLHLFASLLLLIGLAFLPSGARADAAADTPSREEVEKAKNGQVLRVFPFPGLDGADAFRVYYRSLDMKGNPTYVSASVFLPKSWRESRRIDILAWAHPTSGIAKQCGPTLLRSDPGTIAGFDGFMDRGWAVVATDYVGLGNPGEHPYLVGTVAAQSVIDSVKATVSLLEKRASGKFAVWGHSQGGHAALFVGQAPASELGDLELVGVAAAAPPTDLTKLLNTDATRVSDRGVIAYAVWAWHVVYGLPLSAVIDEGTSRRLERFSGICLESLGELITFDDDQKKLGQFLLHIPVQSPPWLNVMKINSPRATAARVPIFISQGARDTTVPEFITKGYIDELCSLGKTVEALSFVNDTHIEVAKASAGDATKWIAERFAGRPPPDTCRRAQR